MDDRTAMERLEQRVARLEVLVRQLVKATGLATVPPEATATSQPAQGEPPRRHEPPVVAQPAMSASPARVADWEQWVGQRGLLIVGVLALLATGGFLLKYAFDRGWVLPWVRVAGAIVIGAGVTVGGDRFLRRGLRRYGAALIGAGGGLAYLGCWAATGPYTLVTRGVGLALLAGVAAAVAWLAVRHRVEGLCAWALLGAYLAPAFLPRQGPTPPALYAYLAIVAVAAGVVAYRSHWRAAFDLTLAGYLILPSVFFVGITEPVSHIGFVTAGGLAGLASTVRRRWAEARLAALGLPWVVIAGEVAGGGWEVTRWSALAAGAALLVAVWWQQRHVDPLLGITKGDIQDPVELTLYAAAPMLLVAWAGAARPHSLAHWGGAVPAATALLYLASGWQARRHHYVGMGLMLLGLAIAGQWDGVAVVIGWTALAVCAVASDRWLGQRSGRGLSLAIAVGACADLFTVAWKVRPSTEVAFVSVWDLGWYGLLVGIVLTARWWPRREPEARMMQLGRPGLWSLAGLALFLGGTQELQRLFVGASPGAGANLAADLSISAFWLVYAAVLVAAGFRLARKPVRVAGLVLAGLAALKVAFYDLANLEALYRVASFFILALIALGVAYAYNRPGAQSAPRSGPG